MTHFLRFYICTSTVSLRSSDFYDSVGIGALLGLMTIEKVALSDLVGNHMSPKRNLLGVQILREAVHAISS